MNNSVHFRGNALGYLYYMGYYAYMTERFDLQGLTYSGCSSGSYMASLFALSLDPIDAITIPFQLQANQSHPLALIGNWKNRLKSCLSDFLPDELNYKDITNLEIGVQYLGKFKLCKQFHSKEDLMECILSSTHIPFLVNFKPFGKYRGQYCFDGELFPIYKIPEERLMIDVRPRLKEKFTPKSISQIISMVEEGYEMAAHDRTLNSYFAQRLIQDKSERSGSEFISKLSMRLTEVCENMPY